MNITKRLESTDSIMSILYSNNLLEKSNKITTNLITCYKVLIFFYKKNGLLARKKFFG